VRGAKSGENIAEVVGPVLEGMGVVENLGCFIGDNDATNDVVIRCVLTKLRKDIKDPGSRRVRCLGHIINLAAKAFLFGREADAFEVETDAARKLTHLEKLRELWRKKGPLGKLHNTLIFIMRTPQRRDAFLKVAGDDDTKGTLLNFRSCLPRLQAWHPACAHLSF
jgi:hypothetical protein